jgi:hypothetical protein
VSRGHGRIQQIILATRKDGTTYDTHLDRETAGYDPQSLSVRQVFNRAARKLPTRS